MSIIILKTMRKKETTKKLMNKIKQKKGLDAKKYCGKIKINQDPLEYQRKIRNEWE